MSLPSKTVSLSFHLSGHRAKAAVLMKVIEANFSITSTEGSSSWITLDYLAAMVM
jgi:hypothetical protein